LLLLIQYVVGQTNLWFDRGNWQKDFFFNPSVVISLSTCSSSYYYKKELCSSEVRRHNINLCEKKKQLKIFLEVLTLTPASEEHIANGW